MYVLFNVDNDECFQAADGSSVTLDSGIIVYIQDQKWFDAELDDYIDTTFSTALGEHTIRAEKGRFQLLYGVGS